MSARPPQINVRMSEGLKEKLHAAAKEHNISVNAEIVSRLSKSFENTVRLEKLRVEKSSNIIRYKTSSSTHGAAKDIIGYLNEITDIKNVTFAVRDGNYNKSALSLIVNGGEEIALFDTSVITAERRPREIELYDICNTLDKLGIFHSAQFILNRVEQTEKLEPEKAYEYLVQQDKATLSISNINYFLTLFCTTEPNPEPYQGIFVEWWEELFKTSHPKPDKFDTSNLIVDPEGNVDYENLNNILNHLMTATKYLTEILKPEKK